MAASTSCLCFPFSSNPSPSSSSSSSSSLSPSRPPPYRLSRASLLTRLPLRGSSSSRRSSEACARYRAWDLPSHAHGDDGGFERAVELFNSREYHDCHDVLEEIWISAEEPVRTLVHGILQCAVGFHHLFNQNHRGAMMELGEGLCKLRKMNFESGPFYQFEKEISEALEFLYLTQKELAACTSDLCLTLDGSERSYLLLGSFAGGQKLYTVVTDQDGVSYVVFCHDAPTSVAQLMRSQVKLPVLQASEEHLKECHYTSNL